MSRRPVAFLLFLLLAACAGRPDGGSLEVATVTAPGMTVHRLMVATTRERAATSAIFSGERADGVDFARVDVSVPPSHASGAIEWPDPEPGDPARQFTVRSIAYIDGATAFRRQMSLELSRLPKGQRTVGVFVHGFNTDFDEGTFRATQLMHDIDFKGVPMLFTWASRGNVLDYVYDRDSATVARDGLEQALELAADAGADDVVIFAHSMGNWLTLETLRQAAISGRADFLRKLDTVVLAAPDIDVDVFKADMQRIGRPTYPFFLLTSSGDRALALSSLLAGDKPRIGAFTGNAQEIADLGVIVIDVSAAGASDRIGHNKYAELLPAFARNLEKSLRSGGDGLERRPQSLAQKAGDVGSALGTIVGSTAGAVVTVPTYIATLPFRLFTRSAAASSNAAASGKAAAAVSSGPQP